MRTFVALNLPAERRHQLHASLQPLARRDLPVRWVEAHSLHLTVKFLGDIEGAEVERIADTLRSFAGRHHPVTLQVGGLGAFPSLRRANTLWVGVAPDAPLMALQRDAELALSRAGYSREQKPFRPHITVARTRSGSRAPDVERLVAMHDWTAVTLVDSIDLMRSHLDSSGARYEPLLRIPLGAEPPA